VGDDLASSNVNRSYSLAASSIAIFTFMLIFLYPRFASGQIDPVVFQSTLGVMAVATFSFVFAAFLYYGSSVEGRIEDDDRAVYARRADRLWLLGITSLFLVPSLILFTVGLPVIGTAWFALWLAYVISVIRYFPRVQTPRRGARQ
jgi:hypothetical protein